MRALLQRVTHASVSVEGQVVGAIGPGLVVLLGVGQGDSQSVADKLADKVVNLRIFRDDADKFNRSLLDVGGAALVVSQFTLYADSRKGRRPNFIAAAPPDVALPLCDYFLQRLTALGVKQVASGRFGTMMLVEIHNDGPVTVLLDSAEWA